MHSTLNSKTLKCLIYSWIFAVNFFGLTSGEKEEWEEYGNEVRREEGESASIEEEDTDDFGSAIEEHIRNIGTAGFVGIIVGAVAIMVVVPLLYCFLCGWLCFNKKGATKKQIKVIKERGSQVESHPDFVLRQSEDKPNIDFYLNRKLSYPPPNDTTSVNQFPLYYHHHGEGRDTRHGSLISYISSTRKSSGVSNGSVGGPQAIWSASADAVYNYKEFSQPVDFSHVLYYYT